MSDKTVLITGATGFVGNRLVERLVLGSDYKTRAMVRRFSGPGLARLARLPTQLVLGDILDPNSLTEAAKGCDVVVHCAYGNSGSGSQRRESTVSGTENVLKAALQAGVRKVIYLSSSAVHGRDPKIPLVDEAAPFKNDRDVYSESKIEAEKLVWRYHREHGLPVVVFRPTLIYGPYGRTWTVRIVKEIQSGAILTNGGSGAANLVYVDNLVDAILLGMEKDAGDGEAFILVDDEQLTWQDVYKNYAEMLDAHPPLHDMSAEEIEAMHKAAEPGVLKQWIVAPLLLVPEMMGYSLRSPEMRGKMRRMPWAKFLARLVPRNVKDWVKGESKSQGQARGDGTPSSQMRLPSPEMIELYASQSRFTNEKVKRVLDYTQRISFAEAMNLTRSWLQYQRLIE